MRERDALKEQTRLKEVAEEALLNEAALRRQAEARGQVAHAAVLFSRGQIEQADAAISDIPLEFIPPSLETAQLMHELGRWHALHERWAFSASRHAALTKAITEVDESDSDDVSRYLLAASAAIIQAGDLAVYDSFRERAIKRFTDSANLIVSEQVLKTTLLAPLVATVQSAVAGIDLRQDRNPYMTAWRNFALGLFEYRRGNYQDALHWLNRCINSPNHSTARTTMAQAISAMAYARMGEIQQARTLLDTSRAVVEERFQRPLDAGSERSGFWFDWVDARMLLRETERVVADSQP